jgi:hypothetical protein
MGGWGVGEEGEPGGEEVDLGREAVVVLGEETDGGGRWAAWGEEGAEGGEDVGGEDEVRSGEEGEESGVGLRWGRRRVG